MRELHLYIETSVWSNWLADDAPEQRDQTQEFLRKCRRAAGAAVLYVSEIVMDELQAASPRLAQELVRLVREHGAVMLRPDSAALELAEAYATHGAIPSSQRADRLHAAIATVAELDILVSWNYRHLVNISRRRKVNSVNGLLGYPKGIEIVSPPEVFEDEV